MRTLDANPTPSSSQRPPPTPSIPVFSSKPSTASPSPTAISDRHPVDDVLHVGDVVGTGAELQGELIRTVHLPTPPVPKGDDDPAAQFEVVRKLGTGSYAVVYLVKEILAHAGFQSRSQPDDCCPTGVLELDPSPSEPRPRRYGREYAIKVLSKANLDQDQLDAQLFEATVHQSLPVHPNIVTLYRTLETSSFLLLLLESVPGEDLFYFLEQSRDHQLGVDSEPHTPLNLAVTPPTPSLLSNISQPLSQGRLRLIASMFSQMCEAVAACHSVNVFHRDIKPENFIVTEAWVTHQDGARERRVVVKLTDFGLATTDIESADMECGSAPYMSYECRNNCAPTYFPRAADVWSLGIVLINMLYHRNPWSDTTVGACPSFDFFLQHPVHFFMNSFTGMTREVAEFLAQKVFCVLDTPDSTMRVSAQDLGLWVKQLPAMMGVSRRSSDRSSRYSDRKPHGSDVSASHDHMENEDLPVPDLALSASSADSEPLPEPEDLPANPRRQRKRGARKGKGSQAALSSPSLISQEDDHLEQMATANQELVRELSRLSNRSNASTPSRSEHLIPPPPVPPVPPLPSPAARKSRWKSVFGSKSSSDPVDNSNEMTETPRQTGATAHHVSNLIMGLSAPVPETDVRGRRRERRDELDADSTHTSGPRVAATLPRTTTPASDRRSERNPSPTSTRSGGRPNAQLMMGPSSQSANWRNSTSSSASSFVGTSSAYTRFSNSSMRSVSTTATSMTSLSASSWRERQNAAPLRRPANVKDMSGIPWELHELPRQCHLEPRGDIFGQPPKPKASAPRRGAAPPPTTPLSTISERPRPALTVYTRQDASTSTTGLSPPNSPRSPEGDGPKKVNKGQINALAKFLSTIKAR